MASFCTKPRTSIPSSRRRTSGLTLTEVLVAAALSLLILGAAFAVAMSSRALFLADQERLSTNQNLRSVLDIVGNDARIVGERLGGTAAVVPALEIIGGQELVLRRSLLETSLPVCDVGGTLSLRIPVARTLLGQVLDFLGFPGCNVLDIDGNLVPDNVVAWTAYRAAHGGTVRAYLYNPTTHQGEFLTYTGESSDLLSYYLRCLESSFAFRYPVSEYASVYLLEEHRYRLRAGVLELIINGDSRAVWRVAGGLTRFEVAALKDGVRLHEFGKNDDWKAVEAIEITVVGAQGRTLSAQFFPRNARSY